MVRLTPDEVRSATAETRRVVVIYEDAPTREHAIQFCNQLARQRPGQLELEILWWSFAFLRDPIQAADAAGKAADAEFVVFAVAAEGDLPQEIRVWIERWLGSRNDREGAVVGLMDRRADPCGIAPVTEVFLRHIAHRAGMDYLSHVPPTALKAIPDSLDSFSRRAGQMTSVLDQILHTHPPPAPPF